MFAYILRTCSCGLILLYILHKCSARHHAGCKPSACGSIQNISYPFRLRTDPRGCGDSKYELACENNTTLLYLDSHKYRVQSINYPNYTIRLADGSVTNDVCSFPQYSQNTLTFLKDHYPYQIQSFMKKPLAKTATFFSCPYPLNYSYMRYDRNCVDRENSSRYTYLKVGHLNASEIGDMCSIELVVLMSMPFKSHKNTSLLEIHSSLSYGFEISWFSVFCGDQCKGGNYSCHLDGSKAACENAILWKTCLVYDKPGCGGIKFMIVRQLLILLLRVVGLTLGSILTVLAIKIVIGWPFLLGLLIYTLRRRHMSMFDLIESFLQNHNLLPIRYTYSNLNTITRGFREQLGKGGYGSVYKGKLRSGNYVAVKLLSTKPGSKGQDFMNEVATIGRIHHVNVVRLVGYCAERSKRALIYDFMPNGSLDKYIRSQETTDTLDWEKKHEIALGVARGIQYLHRGCDIQILHFDIKPHNILLDENFTPKISDFGLAKFYSTENNTVTLTAARGTIGYVAPELINRSIGSVSFKADVYSYGMLLMEMIGLNRDLEENGDESSQYFPYWIYNHLDKCSNIESGIADFDEKITRKMAIVALWCIQMSPDARPSMSRVVEMLEGEVECLRTPPKPSQAAVVFSQNSETDSTDSIALMHEGSSNN